jgi:hypothetical protein
VLCMLVLVALPAAAALPAVAVGAGRKARSVEAVTVKAPTSNGIVVGPPKLYDERTLEQRLQDVIAALSQSKFPEPSGLFGSVGQFQGASASATAMGAALQTLATPSLTREAQAGSLQAASGTSEPGTKTTTQVPSYSPTLPPSPTQISPFSYQPGFGLAPQDLLAGQTELEYQLINLQMLLERSITDREFEVTDAGGGKPRFYPRAQPVIGFEVSLDPTRAYRNAVAEVEVTITPSPDYNTPKEDDAPSLVAMMPQSQTYNVATVSQNSRNLGLGIVAGVLNAGLSAGSAKQTLYLVKDIDTVALEHLPPPGAPESVRFGWQFRPVLGRGSVMPGTRQVFAIIGLPTSSTMPWVGRVSVKTYWRRLRGDKITVYDPIPGSENCQRPWTLLVSPSSDRSLSLQSIDDIILEDVGEGKVAVVLVGTFEPGTHVNVGGRLLDRPESGLITSTTNRIKFVAPAADLVRNIPILVDRYGTGVRVVEQPVPESSGRDATDEHGTADHSFPTSMTRSGANAPAVGQRAPALQKSTEQQSAADREGATSRLRTHGQVGVKRIDDKTCRVTVVLCLDEPDSKCRVYDVAEFAHNATERAGPEFRTLETTDTAEPEMLAKAARTESDRQCREETQFHWHFPVIMIGDQVFGLSGAPIQVEAPPGADGAQVTVTFTAPTQLLVQNRLLVVQDLLWGDRYRATADIPPPLTVSAVQVIKQDGTHDLVVVTGTGLDGTVAKIGGVRGRLVSDDGTLSNLRAFEFCHSRLKGAKHVTLWSEQTGKFVTFASLPPPSGPAAKPRTRMETPIEVCEGDVVVKTVKGEHLDSIKSICLSGTDLPCEPSDDGCTIKISIPVEATETPGKKVPVITLIDGKTVQDEAILSFDVKPRPETKQH